MNNSQYSAPTALANHLGFGGASSAGLAVNNSDLIINNSVNDAARKFEKSVA